MVEWIERHTTIDAGLRARLIDRAARMIAEALAELAPLNLHERWMALLRLLPYVSERAAIVEELIAGIGSLELSWMSLVEAAPEAIPAALLAIAEIADEAQRVDELDGVARYLKGDAARVVCGELLARVEKFPAGSKEWVRAWESALDALAASGCEDMLSGSSRGRLIRELLARPDVDLWSEVVPFVPTELAGEVLAVSHRGLAIADHYVIREAWLRLGWPLLAHVPATQAAAWRGAGGRTAAGYGDRRVVAGGLRGVHGGAAADDRARAVRAAHARVLAQALARAIARDAGAGAAGGAVAGTCGSTRTCWTGCGRATRSMRWPRRRCRTRMHGRT